MKSPRELTSKLINHIQTNVMDEVAVAVKNYGGICISRADDGTKDEIEFVIELGRGEDNQFTVCNVNELHLKAVEDFFASQGVKLMKPTFWDELVEELVNPVSARLYKKLLEEEHGGPEACLEEVRRVKPLMSEAA